ncbi:MAG: response regulator [Clostridia bacterium]
MLRVLLVEDEQKDLQLLKKLIPWDELGLVFSGAAENGKAALDMDEQIHPDIIITDIVLPHQDGVALAQHIRKRRRDVHILLVSGHQDFQYARSAIAAEVDAYILKPVREEELRQVLEKVAAQCIADKRSFYEKSVSAAAAPANAPAAGFIPAPVDYVPGARPATFSKPAGVLPHTGAGGPLCVLVLSPDDPEIKTDEYSRQRIRLELQNSIQQLTAERQMACCFWEDSRDCTILTGCETAEPYPELAQFAGQLIRQAGLLYGISMTAGIGVLCRSTAQAPESYRTALAAVEDRFLPERVRSLSITASPRKMDGFCRLSILAMRR